MSWPFLPLEEILIASGNSRAGQKDLPVLSITMHDGLIDQSTKFKKRIASYNTSSYRVVNRDELVVGFPIDEGVLGFQTKYPAAIVSPAYTIWKLRRPTETYVPFVERYLRSQEAKMLYARMSQGAVARRRNVTKVDFLSISIPFPPLQEQKRLISILDLSDKLRRQRQESIVLCDSFLRSSFIEMFGDPITNSKHLPVDELGNLAVLERGRFSPRPRNDPRFYGGKYPFIQTGDITRSGGIINSWTQTLNESGAAVSKEFKRGTILIAIVGATIGETAIVETPVYCPDSIIGITPYENRVNPEFIEFLLRFWKKRLRDTSPDAARANLNLERLRPLEVIVPPIEKQNEFSSLIAQMRSLSFFQEESKKHLTDLNSSIQQFAFQGKLQLPLLGAHADVSNDAQVVIPEQTVRRRYSRNKAFIAPPDIEKELLELEERLDNGPGDSIPWSEDFFKYRIIGQTLKPPFSFNDIWESAEYDMAEIDYETVKSKIMEYIAAGLLVQEFDIDRKEIVFYPRS